MAVAMSEPDKPNWQKVIVVLEQLFYKQYALFYHRRQLVEVPL